MTRKSRRGGSSDRESDSEKERRNDFQRHVPSRRRSPERNSSRDRDTAKRIRRDSPDRREPEEKQNNDVEKPKKKTQEETLTMKTGGAYIPPAKLRQMQAEIADKSSMEYQRISWEALKKSLHGLINKINISNIGVIIRELFKENVVRGRGLLCRSIMQAQSFSPTFSHVYSALVGVINSKFPQTGELLLRRVVIQFRRGFRRNDKQLCLTSARFVAHLVNQQVAHEILALEMLTLLLETPTEDSVEIAVGFLKECGMKLTTVSPKGVHGIFERLRSVLHEGDMDKRVQYMIEVMFAVRKDGFQDFQAVIKELDLVEEAEQFTHMITLDEATSSEDILNVFKLDPDFEANEEKYKSIKKVILDEGSSGSEGSGSESEEGSEEEDSEGEEGNQEIIDNTETNLISLRRTIYLTIQSSLDFEECAHKLLKLELKPGQIIELCHMILDCCAQQRTYEKFYGLLAQRFCQLNKIYVEPFQEIFKTAYDTIHRFETNKLRNVAKFFAHLLYTDAITWLVLASIRLNEDETTSSSRIFIKILFQELCEYMSLPKLNDRVKDPTLQEAFDGLFPRDNPQNTRFAINFFTSIGLGGLTDDLREHLKTMPKVVPPPVVVPPPNPSAVEGSSSDNEEDSSSEDESEESEEEKPKKKKKSKSKRNKLKKKSKHKKKEKKNKTKHAKEPAKVSSNQEAIQRLRSEIQYLEKEQEKLQREKERRRLLEEANRLQSEANEQEKSGSSRKSPSRNREETREKERREAQQERIHKPREEEREKGNRWEEERDKANRRDDEREKPNRRDEEREKATRRDDEREKANRRDDEREKATRRDEDREKANRRDEEREKANRRDEERERPNRRETQENAHLKRDENSDRDRTADRHHRSSRGEEVKDKGRKDRAERTRDLPRSIRERSRERQRERVDDSPRKKSVQNWKEERRPRNHDNRKSDKERDRDHNERRWPRDGRVLAEVKI